ncbi:hypothetical protein, partial [Microbulbifer mangrovi]|uniref:hypothetical protein n=1 Tax=Microbulbifer mangrovi TaxID=927787 RepID=UPI00195951CB
MIRGLRPLTPSGSPFGRSASPLAPCEPGLCLDHGQFCQIKKGRILSDAAFFNLVELSGIEPLTS